MLRHFQNWLRHEYLGTSLSTINEIVIRHFILYLQDRPGTKDKRASSHTIANRVRSLKAFFAWGYDERYTDVSVLAKVREPRTDDLIIEPLTDEEVEAIFASINADIAMGARNAAIVSLALGSGLRLSELPD